MMNSASSYIANVLEALAAQFPTATVCYLFSKSERMHIIDVQGRAIEALNADEWVGLYDGWVEEFESKFSDDSLLFVRQGSLVRVAAARADRVIEPKQPVAEMSLAEAKVYSWASDYTGYAYAVMSGAEQGGKARGKPPGPPRTAPGREFILDFESVLTPVGADSFFGV